MKPLMISFPTLNWSMTTKVFKHVTSEEAMKLFISDICGWGFVIHLVITALMINKRHFENFEPDTAFSSLASSSTQRIISWYITFVSSIAVRVWPPAVKFVPWFHHLQLFQKLNRYDMKPFQAKFSIYDNLDCFVNNEAVIPIQTSRNLQASVFTKMSSIKTIMAYIIILGFRY